MGLRKWIKKQSGKRSDKAGRRKTEDQLGSSAAAGQAGQPRPTRPGQPTATSPNPALQNVGTANGVPGAPPVSVPVASSVTTVQQTTAGITGLKQGPIVGSTSQPTVTSQTYAAPVQGTLPPAGFGQAQQVPSVSPSRPAAQVSLADIPATTRLDRADSAGSFVSARSHASEWSQTPSRTASSNLDPLDLGPVSSYDRAAANYKSPSKVTSGDTAYRRPDHAAVTQAVLDLEAAADRPQLSASQPISSTAGVQQSFVSQPVKPSLTEGQLSAAGEQGYAPAGVSPTQQASLGMPQSQLAGIASSVDQSSQGQPVQYVSSGAPLQASPAVSAFGQQPVQSQVDTQHARPMQATATPGIQETGQGYPGQPAAQPASNAPFRQAEALQPSQQVASSEASSYALDRHSALMRAAEEHERAMQAERSSQGPFTDGSSLHQGNAGLELPGQLSGAAPQAVRGLPRVSYESDRHAALMRAAEAHEQALQASQARATAPTPAGSATEPAGAYASDRHAALMRAALANEQPHPQPYASDNVSGSERGLQDALPTGVNASQDVHVAQPGTGAYASERHAALMRAAEEHEQRLLQSPDPAAQQELFYVSDRHAALMRAAEEHERQRLAEPVGTASQQAAAGYESDRHAALMRAVAAYEQTPEVEQPPEQHRNEVTGPGAPMQGSMPQHESYYDQNDQGRYRGQQTDQQAAPSTMASGQAAAPTNLTNGGMGNHLQSGGPAPHAAGLASKQQPADSYHPAANGHHDQAYLQGTHVQHAPVQTATGAGHAEQSSLQSPAEPQQDVVQLYNDGRIFQAHKLLEQLCQQRSLPFPAKAQEVMPAGPLTAATIIQEADRIKQALADLAASKSWPVVRDAPGDLSVWYQHKSGSPVHSVRLEGTFATSIECLLAMGREFDLASTWNKYMLDSVVLSEPSLFEATLYASNWLPFPFSPCDCIVHAKGYDLAQEDRSLFILMETPAGAPEDLPGQPLPATYPKRKHTAMMPGSCMRMQPVQPGPDGRPRTIGTMMIHLDPKVAFVPAWLMSFILKIMSPFAYNQMVETLREAFADDNAVIPQRMAAKPELYAQLHERTAASVPWTTSL